MRDTTDLLGLELVFTQQQPLKIDEFEAACALRGLELWPAPARLEAFHRAGFLTPLFRYRKDVSRSLADARRAGLLIPWALDRLNINERTLRQALSEERLYDPRGESCQPWSRYRRVIESRRCWTSEFLYSPYQLLLVPNLARIVPWMRLRRRGPDAEHWRFSHVGFTDQRLIRIREENDELVLVLTALESRYRPLVLLSLTEPASVAATADDWWDRYCDAFDPIATLNWLGWTPARVQSVANGLIARASAFDPLWEWFDLVRQIRPEKWLKLRGDALIALEYRIAAEMLHLFYDDLVRAGEATAIEIPAGRGWHPHKVRLRPDHASLDAVLMDYGVAPYPSLVLVVEGETEMVLVPRVMDLLGVPRWSSFIELMPANGVSTRLDSLIHFVAPRLGQEIHSGVLLSRPVTRFFGVFDPERPYETGRARETERKKWASRMVAALPRQYQTSHVLGQLDSAAVIETWSTESLEFAHFSDAELADGILRTYRGATKLARADLIQWIHNIRRSKGNLEKSLLKSLTLPRPSKPDLMEALWPTLEAKIRDAQVRGTVEEIPVARVVLQATRMAQEWFRADIMLSTGAPSAATSSAPMSV